MLILIPCALPPIMFFSSNIHEGNFKYKKRGCISSKSISSHSSIINQIPLSNPLFNMKFFTAAVALVAASVANAYSFTNCAPANAILAIDSFVLTPDPNLCTTQPACVTGTGKLSAPVTAGGSLSIIGKLGALTVYSDIQDLCTVLGNNGLPCPVPTSTTSLHACVPIKSGAPTGVSDISNSFYSLCYSIL